MAKGVGLIGNFKGKVGNTVGYSLKDSNNKQTQGIRVYQPVVRNPKTYAQAEQRAKLAPINATYRALKLIIDRGQEGLAYGNKSRLAWLSDAIKAFAGGYFDKGAAITAPALVPLTKGSLPNICGTQTGDGKLYITINTTAQTPTTMGALSELIIASIPAVKDGDQITFVGIKEESDSSLGPRIFSFIVNTTSTEQIPDKLTVNGEKIQFNDFDEDGLAGTVILSREGDNNAHLRSTNKLVKMVDYPADILTDAAKEAAIVSYMSQGANTDWAEESLMQ